MSENQRTINAIIDIESMHVFFNHIFRTTFTLIAGAILAFYFTFELVNKQQAIIWLTSFITFMLLSTGWIFYRTQKFSDESLTTDEGFWRQIRILANAIGLLWMIGEFILYVPNSLLHQLLLMIVTVLLISAGSYATMSVCPRMFLAFAAPSALPFAIYFIQAGDVIHLVLAVAFTLAVAYQIWIGQQFNGFMEQTRLARYHSEELAIQLAKQKQLAEHANRAKSVFLAAAGHDLRQPVHALGLLLENLQGRTQGAEDILDLMHSSTETMRGLLESLLDISKLDAAVVTPTICGFALDELLERVKKNFSAMAVQKGLAIDIKFCGLIVQSDPNLLYSVIANLVANAIKYTNEGKVSIICSKSMGHAKIEVIDTGPGIPYEEQHNIFQEYYQLKKSNHNHSHGLGLGLAIVDRLIKLLTGHSVELSSSETKGTNVSVNLPLTTSASFSSINLHQDIIPEFSGRKILIVDNEPAIQIGLARLLEKWGCSVNIAATVEDAMNVIRKNNQLDMIITDMNLKESNDGLSLIDMMRRLDGEAIAYLLISGETNSESLIKMRDSGLNVLSKPVAPARLRLTMASILQSELRSAA